MEERAFRYTAHALAVMQERGLDRAWIERTINNPLWTDRDPVDADLLRAFARVPECSNRILRVIYRHGEAGVVVITAFFDRKARER